MDEWVVRLLKLLSQAIAITVGIWGLFSRPIKTDRKTRKKSLTDNGKLVLTGFLIAFLTFCFSEWSDYNKEQKKLREEQERANAQIAQKENEANLWRQQFIALRATLRPINLTETSVDITIYFSTKDGVFQKYGERLNEAVERLKTEMAASQRKLLSKEKLHIELLKVKDGLHALTIFPQSPLWPQNKNPVEADAAELLNSISAVINIGEEEESPESIMFMLSGRCSDPVKGTNLISDCKILYQPEREKISIIVQKVPVKASPEYSEKYLSEVDFIKAKATVDLLSYGSAPSTALTNLILHFGEKGKMYLAIDAMTKTAEDDNLVFKSVLTERLVPLE